MDTMSIDEVLARLGMTPAELAGKLSHVIKTQGFDRLDEDDEPLQIVAVHDELKRRLKIPLRSL